MSRDWRAVRDAKDSYWADRIARLGPIEGLRVADDLWHYARALNPTWPRDEDRDEDFRAHLRLARLLRHASNARRR